MKVDMHEKNVAITKTISAQDLTTALLSEMPLSTGLLPQNTLWWRQSELGSEVALWRPPTIWNAALQVEAFKQPRRFKLPMPGLIFICTPGHGPRVFAAKRRPGGIHDALYHAPLFNVYSNGNSCPGTNKYPKNVNEIPENFFISFFSVGADTHNRSKKYPDSLLKLWEELDGTDQYPVDDLVPTCKIKDIIGDIQED